MLELGQIGRERERLIMRRRVMKRRRELFLLLAKSVVSGDKLKTEHISVMRPVM